MLLLKNAMLVTMKNYAAPQQGDILINDDGKIAALGPGAGDGIEKEPYELDLSGKVILPGLIDAHSHISGNSVMPPYDDNVNELTAPLTPQLNSRYGISFHSPAFHGILKDGVTASCIVPGSGNVIGGIGVVVKSAGTNRKKRILKDPAVLKAAVGLNPKSIYAPKTVMPMTRMGIAWLLRDYFCRVQEYREKKKEAEQDQKYFPVDAAMEHGLWVLEKKIPLKVHAYQQDMMFVLDIAREFDILVTMDHAQGASDFIEQLKDSHVKGIVFGPIVLGLGPGEACKADYEALPLLDEAGILTSVMTDGPVASGEVLIHQVGEAVRVGMDPVRALAMVTCNPARILGCENRIGSLAPGMDADLAVFDGMPGVDVCAANIMTVLDGKIVWKKEGA